jgi:glycosyltransferase involved in cell wall biosynthesis
VVDNSKIIPNPIEKMLDFEYQVNSNRIIAIGRLVPQKNFSLLIRAFSILINNNEKLTLHIFGDVPLREHLQKEIDLLGMGDLVILRGIVDHIEFEYKNSMLFVQTSNFEGQSNALVEAMVHGVPVLVVNYTGLRETISNYINGLILYTNKANILANEMKKLVDDIELRKQMSNEGKKIIGKHDIFQIVNQWQKLIDSSY